MITYDTLTEIICNFTPAIKEGVYFVKSRNEDKFVSYKDVYKKALQVLYNMQSKGLKPGEQLLFQIKDEYIEEYVYIFWACILGRITIIPLEVSNNENAAKVFNIWDKLNNSKIVTDKSVLDNLNRVAKNVGLESNYKDVYEHKILIDELMSENGIGKIQYSNPEDIVMIQFSSGSTGNSKGVVLTHENLVVNSEDIARRIDITNKDSMLNWMPLTHAMAMVMFHITAFAQHTNLYLITPAMFTGNPLLWFEKLDQYNITISSTPNFGLKLFLDVLKNKTFNWDLSSVRLLANGAEPISVDLTTKFFDQMKKYGLKKGAICPIYGLSEASFVTIPYSGSEWKYLNVKRDSVVLNKKVVEIKEENKIDEGAKYVSVGAGLDRCAIRIFDGNNIINEECVIGHIQLKSKSVMKGYYKDLESTSKILSEDGWLDTGDLGFLKDGELYITGRFKDIIFVNGSNYFPNDVESICEKADGIRSGSAVVVGMYDEIKQKELLLVFILFKSEVKEFIQLSTNIKTIIREKIGIDVNNVIPINVIPKTAGGKIQRYKLIEMYKNHQFDSLIKEIDKLEKEKINSRYVRSPKNKIEEDLVEICKKTLNMDYVGTNDKFIDFGGSSLLMTNIFIKIDDKYPDRIQITDLYSSLTIAELAALIEASDYTLDNSSRDEVEDESNNEINYIMKEDAIKYFKTLEVNKKIRIDYILLLLLAYQISNSVGQHIIRVNYKESNRNDIRPMYIDFSNIEYMDQLFEVLGEKFNKIDTDIEAYEVNQAINPLIIYGNDYIDTNEILKDIYDFIVNVNENKNKVICTFIYSRKNVLREEVEQLISNYIEFIKFLSKNNI